MYYVEKSSKSDCDFTSRPIKVSDEELFRLYSVEDIVR